MEYNSDESGPTSRKKNRKKFMIESDDDNASQPSDAGVKAALARRRGSRPFPKRQEQLKPSVLGDDSTEDNDRSSDEDYHLSDEDKPNKKPRHRGKPAWATKPLPKKKPEYAVDRHLNGLSQKDKSNSATESDTAKLNHNNSTSSASLNSNNKTSADSGGTTNVVPPTGPVLPDVLGEDIAALEHVDDLVNYVVQDDA